ncbi:sensor histidine kinase [Paenibacillus sp. F411]|uniref:sensor histidine kinase n=1 Tax=Paenibacillus sp. F411 TaxID=2820239 RepID=UPI001AAFCE1C|nr:sensor histidine kinase [Paenibacillus sp. F411]MBO2943385.1 sensor histidine kinase [Paenibacillus sp. F411]
MMYVLQWIRSITNNLKLRTKLVISFTLFLVLPLGIYTVISYNQAAEILRNQTIVNADQAFDEAVNGVHHITEYMDQILNSVSLNKGINTILSKNEYSTLYQQIADYFYIENTLQEYESNRFSLRLELYMKDSFEQTSDNVNTFTYYSARQENWYQIMEREGLNTYWFNEQNVKNGVKYLSVSRKIWDLNNLNRQVGIIKIKIEEEMVLSILENSIIHQDSQVFLEHSPGHILLRAGILTPDIDKAASFLGKIEPEQSWEPYTYDNQQMLVNQASIRGTPWNLTTIVPMNSVLKNITALNQQMLWSMLIIAVIGYVMALYTANLTTLRITKLIQRMKGLPEGRFLSIQGYHGRDEVGELIDNYNYMIEQIQRLMKDKFEAGKALKHAELRTLQAQINPHFLYNTLDVINIMAAEHGVSEISHTVKQLTTYYKLGLNKGRDMVSLKDELKHVEAYIEIQNIRFEHSCNLSIDVPESLLSCMLPKLTLQPIIENAVIHGILESSIPEGQITIKVYAEGDTYFIQVTDTGPGFKPASLNTSFQQDQEHLNGFGMVNVHERICLTYGDTYGLEVDASYADGARVTLKLPIYKDEDSISSNQFSSKT